MWLGTEGGLWGLGRLWFYGQLVYKVLDGALWAIVQQYSWDIKNVLTW